LFLTDHILVQFFKNFARRWHAVNMELRTGRFPQILIEDVVTQEHALIADEHAIRAGDQSIDFFN
jgi:hypothetical protein